MITITITIVEGANTNKIGVSCLQKNKAASQQEITEAELVQIALQQLQDFHAQESTGFESIQATSKAGMQVIKDRMQNL